MLILKYVCNRIANIPSTSIVSEDIFIEFVFPKNTNLSFGSSTFTIKKSSRYDFSAKKCDRKFLNSNFNIWCEGKLLCKLLPVNDLNFPENLVLYNETNFLDIARLIALIKSPRDIRMSIGNIEISRLSHYGININSDYQKLKSYFTVKDVFPVRLNRDAFVQLSYSTSLDIWIFPKCNLQVKNRYTACPFLIFVNDGDLSVKVVRDFNNASVNSQSHVSLRKKSNITVLNNFFPAS